MRVLALDPGERVGWARADVTDNGEWENLRHGITPLRDMAIAVSRTLGREGGVIPPGYDLVIIEDWRLYAQEAKNMIGSSFPSVQFIGMVKLSCWLSGTKLVMQGASIKPHADRVLEHWKPDIYELVTRPIRHDDGHDQDALRHLAFWTWKNCEIKEVA